ncbi:hypothetical protein HPP92_002378 [Vanilla planifolia]|uniref:Uncharacterized protein n=1 Tax=Vanilla planifolia TaxID=51239 RepID=A0A835S9M8_VANPL|nr:hypothetical protein HPP92_002378 [Vanilla planifolia]
MLVSIQIPCHTKNIQMNLHINKVEENSGCTNSSLSSVVSANCQDEVCPLEAKVASSGSYILNTNSHPAGISGCLERNQAVSSPCTASFQEKNSMLENNVDVSVRTLQNNVSVDDVLSKSNREASMHADATNNAEMIECQRLKLRNTGYDNTDNSALSNCEENNLRKSIESLGNTRHANVSVTKSDIDIDVMKLERGLQISD